LKANLVLVCYLFPYSVLVQCCSSICCFVKLDADKLAYKEKRTYLKVEKTAYIIIYTKEKVKFRINSMYQGTKNQGTNKQLSTQKTNKLSTQQTSKQQQYKQTIINTKNKQIINTTNKQTATIQTNKQLPTQQTSKQTTGCNKKKQHAQHR